jgi:hypothetical protein
MQSYNDILVQIIVQLNLVGNNVIQEMHITAK